MGGNKITRLIGITGSRTFPDLLVYAFTGWACCFLSMTAGRAFFSVQTALIMHLVCVPLIYSGTTLLYCRRYPEARPAVTAMIFFLFAGLMEFIVVALLIDRGLAIFMSIPGTWMPLLLVFISSFVTGERVLSCSRRRLSRWA